MSYARRGRNSPQPNRRESGLSSKFVSHSVHAMIIVFEGDFDKVLHEIKVIFKNSSFRTIASFFLVEDLNQSGII